MSVQTDLVRSMGSEHRPALAKSRHGILTPPGISRSRPHCVIPRARGCDWTEVSW